LRGQAPLFLFMLSISCCIASRPRTCRGSTASHPGLGFAMYLWRGRDSPHIQLYRLPTFFWRKQGFITAWLLDLTTFALSGGNNGHYLRPRYAGANRDRSPHAGQGNEYWAMSNEQRSRWFCGGYWRWSLRLIGAALGSWFPATQWHTVVGRTDNADPSVVYNRDFGFCTRRTDRPQKKSITRSKIVLWWFCVTFWLSK
jgi:hypothetical protein